MFNTGTALSFRNEFILVASILLFFTSIPFLGILIITNVGLPILSNSLVTVDLTTHFIQIHDPKTGTISHEINAPVQWPVRGIATLEFGASDLPYQPFHTGIDIANPHHKIGDPIHPFMNGTVMVIGNLNWGYGGYIIIAHDDEVSSLYAHLSRINVQVGQHVELSDVIGLEGQTGWTTGPHLHFQINVYGIPINPRIFIQSAL